MNDLQIQRINELYHKSQKEGLTEEEKAEQKKLRQAYIAAIRADLQSTIDNISIVNPDNTITDLKDYKKNRSEEQ